MDTTTAICAVVALALLAKLWSVLGRRDDNDKNADAARFNPFASSDAGKSAAKNNMSDDEGGYHPPVKNAGNKPGDNRITDNRFAGMLGGIKPAAADAPGFAAFRHAPESVAGGLEQIRRADPAFDEKDFLRRARVSFTVITEDFAKGDLARAKTLLGPTVLPHFERAIAARQASGQMMDSKILAIRDAEVTAIKVTDSVAAITVQFTSEQQTTLRGTDSTAATPQVEEIGDIWVFSRDLKNFKTEWLVTETRS